MYVEYIASRISLICIKKTTDFHFTHHSAGFQRKEKGGHCLRVIWTSSSIQRNGADGTHAIIFNDLDKFIEC